MLTIIARFLAFNGFTHGMCGRYEILFFADGTIGARRRYRFRWQILKTHGGQVSRRNRFMWTSKLKIGGRDEFYIARLPDSGQLSDAIGIANDRAVAVYERNKIEERKAFVADMSLDELDIEAREPDTD